MVFDWKKNRQNQRFGGLIPALKSNFSINLKFLFCLIMPSLLFSGLFLANYPKFSILEVELTLIFKIQKNPHLESLTSL